MTLIIIILVETTSLLKGNVDFGAGNYNGGEGESNIVLIIIIIVVVIMVIISLTKGCILMTK